MMSACRLVLVLISFVLLQTICEAGLFPAKRTINITNDVYVQSELDLTVHCKSCDDDLGEHVLPFNGWYSFSFRPWRNTLFYCSFAWKNQIERYDIYVDKRDHDQCRYCRWFIRYYGPCYWNYEFDLVNCLQW